MKKIITAIGNENINNELKKQKNLKIILNDIQYKEGIIEILENYEDLDIIILNSELPGEIDIKILIQKILEINKRIKIIIFSENKNEELEKYFYNKGVYKVLSDNEIEIEDLLKIINNNSENEDLKEEINKLKQIILEKEKQKNKNILLIIKNKIKKIILKIKEIFNKKTNKKNNSKLNNNLENKKISDKIICITGPSGVGKSIVSINLAKSYIYSKNKILIIDSDFKNNSIQTILGIKNNPNKYVKDNKLIKINKKIDLLILKKLLFNNEINNDSQNNTYLKLKEMLDKYNYYDYIIIDTNSNENDLIKNILELSNKIIFISDTNLSEVNKSIKLLDIFINKYKININKFNILFNKCNNYSIALKILNKIFGELKIIGYLKYNEKYNKLINKNNRNSFINKKIRKEYLKIIKNK